MAYDVKKLIEKSRQKGGPDAEKLLKANWEAMKEWLLESAIESENKIDDIGMPMALPVVDKVLQPVLDQIDGAA